MLGMGPPSQQGQYHGQWSMRSPAARALISAVGRSVAVIVETARSDLFLRAFWRASLFCFGAATMMVDSGGGKSSDAPSLLALSSQASVACLSLVLWMKHVLLDPLNASAMEMVCPRKKRFTNTPETKEKNLSKFARAGFNYEISIKILNEI